MPLLDFFRKKPQKLHDYTDNAKVYLLAHYEPPKTSTSNSKFSREANPSAVPPKKPDKKQDNAASEPDLTGEVRYSISVDLPHKDREVKYSAGPLPDFFNKDRVTRLIQNADDMTTKELSRQLDSTLNQSFTDKLIELINEKGMRDSAVYRAAQMDRRLFSKIMSNREFKPAKDTALALIIALQLSLPQATDLLSRAGYTLSHSSKRDVIIEYFIREGIYNLMEVNLVLDKLELKIIGR